jgi:hypothetical protein
MYQASIPFSDCVKILTEFDSLTAEVETIRRIVGYALDAPNDAVKQTLINGFAQAGLEVPTNPLDAAAVAPGEGDK